MKFRMKIWYRLSDEDSPQVEENLTEQQIEQATGAFLRDMTYLKGAGCRKFEIEVQP